MFDTVLSQLAVVAVFVQRVLDFLKPLYQNSTRQKYIDKALSLAISAVLCALWGVDVFSVVDIHFNLVWLGGALTGVFAGFGSSVLNDLLKLLEIWKKKNLPQG